MAIQHPQYFGYEAQVFWSTTTFPLDDPTGYAPLLSSITSWLNAGTTFATEEPVSVNFDVTQMVQDITPRPVASRGFMTSYVMPNEISVSFQVRHNRAVGSVMEQLTSSWSQYRTANALLGLAFLDRTSSAGIREGIMGNFRISMTKSEALREFQSWTVTAVPFNWIDYWKE